MQEEALANQIYHKMRKPYGNSQTHYARSYQISDFFYNPAHNFFNVADVALFRIHDEDTILSEERLALQKGDRRGIGESTHKLPFEHGHDLVLHSKRL